MRIAPVIGVLVLSCSRNSSSDASSSGGSGPNDCACEVSSNGVSKNIGCGENACVNGRTYSCSDDARVTPGEACSTPTPDAGDKGSCAFTCELGAPGNQSLKTKYCCPDSASLRRCNVDVSKCNPIDHPRGTVPPGGACDKDTFPTATYERGDNCAPNPTRATAKHPKGSYCELDSEGRYCSHPCSSLADCADVASGVAECSSISGTCQR